MENNKPIIYIGGGKGGVGKSLVSCALIDFFLKNGEKVFLIETDTNNPDVYKTYNASIDTATFNLTNKDGWIDFVSECAEHKDHYIIVNTGAGNAEFEQAFMQGSIITALPMVEREFITLWVINRQRDSIELLKSYTSIIEQNPLHVIMNGYFGDETKFSLYRDSKLKKELEESGTKSLLFPDLADRVSDDLYSKRMTIDNAVNSDTIPIGNKVELVRWRNDAHQQFEVLFSS